MKRNFLKASFLTPLAIVFFSSTIWAAPEKALIVCSLYEGTGTVASIAFEGHTAIVNGERLGCGQIPVSFGTIRAFPEGKYAISKTCGPDGGGIYARQPSPVSLYLQGWMSGGHVFYADFDGNIYRCAG